MTPEELKKILETPEVMSAIEQIYTKGHKEGMEDAFRLAADMMNKMAAAQKKEGE